MPESAGVSKPPLPAVPAPLVMLLAALAIGVGSGLGSKALLAALDAGFGASLAEYALILIPAFALAAALSGQRWPVADGRGVSVLAPLAGAAMSCPDTAYAALAPVSGPRKLSVLFGAYAGFKLLVPAGPAIVATGLGGFDLRLAIAALPVFFVAWATGEAYARRLRPVRSPPTAGRLRLEPSVAAPLAVLLGLLVLGFGLRRVEGLPSLVGFLVSPKGALLLAAGAALWPLSPEARAAALDSATRRTAPLLLAIGAASALGAMLVEVLPTERLANALVSTGLVLPALFLLTAAFKTLKGSSMATFAGTSGVVAALLPSLHVSTEAAALAMCAGAFVCIGPNDSLYWLVRHEVFAGCPEREAMRGLALGSALQGCAALVAVLGLHAAGVV